MMKLIYIIYALLAAAFVTSMFKSPKIHAEKPSVRINKEEYRKEYRMWLDSNRCKDKIVIDSLKQKLNVH